MKLFLFPSSSSKNGIKESLQQTKNVTFKTVFQHCDHRILEFKKDIIQRHMSNWEELGQFDVMFPGQGKG